VAGLVPVLALLFLIVAVGVWAATLFLQGYTYSEPVEQLYWRAPACGLAITLLVAFWCSLDYRNPGRYGALFDFSARDTEKFDKFWSVKNGKEILFSKRPDARGRIDYFDSNGKRWSRSDTDGIMEAIIVEDKDGQKIRFNAELTPDGKFKTDKGQPVRYLETGGKHRVMTDDYIGQLSEWRVGFMVANLVLNFFHLVLWFLCLWLLLRFQWAHALGLALVFWVVLTFFLPTLFKKTEDLARQKASVSTSAGMFPAGRHSFTHFSNARSTSECAGAPDGDRMNWVVRACSAARPADRPGAGSAAESSNQLES